MATAQPLPAPQIQHVQQSKAAGDNEAATEQALVASPAQPVEEDLVVLTGPMGRLPLEVEVAVPAREFRVRHLLALAPGQLIETQWAHGEDLPLAAGNVQLAWSEFEVVDAQLAVRVTRLA